MLQKNTALSLSLINVLETERVRGRRCFLRITGKQQELVQVKLYDFVNLFPAFKACPLIFYLFYYQQLAAAPKLFSSFVCRIV